MLRFASNGNLPAPIAVPAIIASLLYAPQKGSEAIMPSMARYPRIGASHSACPAPSRFGVISIRVKTLLFALQSGLAVGINADQFFPALSSQAFAGIWQLTKSSRCSYAHGRKTDHRYFNLGFEMTNNWGEYLFSRT